MFAFCFLGPLFYHTDQVHTNLNKVTLPPGAGHPLGTDDTGYDELGRLMAGGQTSLIVGLAAAIIATFFGGLWGAVSGYAGGVVDSVMMRVVDVILSIPTLFLLLFMAAIFRPTRADADHSDRGGVLADHRRGSSAARRSRSRCASTSRRPG